MRKNVLCILFATLFLFSPVYAHARTAQEILDLIAQLEAQIAKLKIELALLPQETSSAMPFQNTLKHGDRHEEARKLQDILRSEGLFCTGCTPTGYFGYWTKAGLMNFQQRYNLSITGVTDEPTRRKLNQMSQESSASQTSSFAPDASPPFATLDINGEAKNTTNPEVLLALTCIDSDKIDSVRYSNAEVFTNEPWIGFSPGFRWRLSSGDGLKTVYFQCKDKAGNIAHASDAIILDTTPPSRTTAQTSFAFPMGTVQANLSLATGESATCRYSRNPGKQYDEMEPLSLDFAATHSIAVSLQLEGVQTFYIKCADLLGNKNKDDFEISFQVGNPTDTSYDVNVLVIKYFPLTEDKSSLDETVAGNVQGSFSSVWQKTIDMTQNLQSALKEGTAYLGQGLPSLRYSVADVKTRQEAMPTKNDPVPNYPDYHTALLQENICDYVNNQNVQEVWIFAYPSLNISESKMSGPFGDVSNSKGRGDLPLCSKTYRVYPFDYSKGTAEALLVWTRQLEAELKNIDLLLFEIWQGPPDPQKRGVIARCGSALYPPNSRNAQDYANDVAQESDCLRWNPDSIGPRTYVSCAHWGCQNKSDSDNPQLNYLVWNLQHLPGRTNTKTYKGKPLRNWWDVHGNFDNVMANSRTLVLE